MTTYGSKKNPLSKRDLVYARRLARERYGLGPSGTSHINELRVCKYAMVLALELIEMYARGDEVHPSQLNGVGLTLTEKIRVLTSFGVT